MEMAETEDQAGKSLVAQAPETHSIIDGEKLPPMVRGFALLPRGRQIGVIVAVASALALGVAVLLWSQKQEYGQLFGHIPEKEAGEIVEALKKLNVPYEFEAGTGSIMAPAERIHELRLKLATQGLPREDSQGYDLLDKESSFGSSQMMENARFHRALEGEIARSIMTIRHVKSARIHLALPKESVFVRQPKKPSASVIVDLNSGHGLDPGQVEAIVHLVASSVPQLEPEDVTVVDQRGHLLNSSDSSSGMNLTGKQFDYKKQVEDHLIERVENILSPVVGRDGLRTQVAVDIDFSQTERTQELFNPDLPALRSEQTREEQSRNPSAVQGVPGALSNQPPPAGVAPEVAGQQPGQTGAGGASQEPANASKSATRNFELDKTISHSRLGTGEIRRLTVAVVVDHQKVLQPDGSYASQPFSEEDLTRFNSLVKEAVGFDTSRGDRVTVTNAAFRPEIEEPEAQPWEQPWFWSLAKQVGAGIVILLLVFGVLRPMIKGLIGRDEAERAATSAAASASVAVGEGKEATFVGASGGGEGGGTALTDEGDELLLLDAPQSYEKRLEFAQRAIDQDPKRVAQVLKNWMNEHG